MRRGAQATFCRGSLRSFLPRDDVGVAVIAIPPWREKSKVRRGVQSISHRGSPRSDESELAMTLSGTMRDWIGLLQAHGAMDSRFRGKDTQRYCERRRSGFEDAPWRACAPWRASHLLPWITSVVPPS